MRLNLSSPANSRFCCFCSIRIWVGMAAAVGVVIGVEKLAFVSQRFAFGLIYRFLYAFIYFYGTFIHLASDVGIKVEILRFFILYAF